MRKTILISLIAFLFVFAICGLSYAAVTGRCDNCHTMHYSQNATVLSTWGTGGPYDVLLTNDCLGCHTTTGSDPRVSNYPYVKSTTGGLNDDNCLAGGFFQVTDSSGNNNDMAHSLGNTNDPAGCDDTANTWYEGGTAACGAGGAAGLSCAGTSGCHGNQTDDSDMAAIKGGHHGSTTYGYRILAVGANPVLGTGASDYEEALINAPDTGDARNAYNATVGGPSISELCGKCHGDFHGTANTNASSPFIRHPTDAAIPNTWEIYTDFTNKWTNDADAWKNHPLGFDGAENVGNSRVTCLSCHRAHGTENNDLLRWSYGLMEAGTTGVDYGCLGCHNRQRG